MPNWGQSLGFFHRRGGAVRNRRGIRWEHFPVWDRGFCRQDHLSEEGRKQEIEKKEEGNVWKQNIRPIGLNECCSEMHEANLFHFSARRIRS